eukprot:4984788-Amphidinium_carterae.1
MSLDRQKTGDENHTSYLLDLLPLTYCRVSGCNWPLCPARFSAGQRGIAGVTSVECQETDVSLLPCSCRFKD